MMQYCAHGTEYLAVISQTLVPTLQGAENTVQ